MKETLEEVIEFCKKNNRVCPRPIVWIEFYSMLKNRKQNPKGEWEPPLPLLMSAWTSTSANEKQSRFIEHLKWAHKEGQINVIYTIIKRWSESNWFHQSEF